MDSEDKILRALRGHGLSRLDAIARLQRLGYEFMDAEAVVDEWIDSFEDEDDVA